MSNFLLSQILIGFAICFDMMSFQFKDRKKIVLCFFCASILIGVHFALLEQYTAAGLVLITAIRFLTSIFTTSKKVMSLFLVSYTVVTVVTFAGLLSLLTYGASMISSVASFCKDDKFLRQLMLLSTIIWVVHNYYANSPAAVLMEILFICSNSIGYYRHYIKPKKVQVNPNKIDN